MKDLLLAFAFETMLKIAHFTNVIDGRSNSGTARVARELITELSKRDDVRQFFIHFDNSDDPIYSLPNSVNIVLNRCRFPIGSRFLGFIQFILVNRYKGIYDFDIVHWHVARIYPLFHLLPTKATIVTIHDAGNYLLNGVMDLPNWIFRLTYELFQTRIRYFIVVSENAKNNLISKSRINKQRILVNYPATDIKSKSMKTPKEFVGIPKDALIVLCVSRWQKHKNVEILISCFEKISWVNERAHLLIVGKAVGSYNFPQSYIDKLPKSRVTVMCDLEDSELAYLYSMAYINVAPSLHEGFGLNVLEAMSFGCPSIVDKFTATAEIAERSGICVDMRNERDLQIALENILNEPKTRARLSIESTKRALTFSWNKFANQMIDIYQNSI